MELNLTTFVLEILNFCVLVWLLKRFFYKPVKDVIARRRQSIEEQLQKAMGVQQEAELLREQYGNRLADWENERQDAREQLQQEIDVEHLRLMSELQQDLDAERKKNEVLAERQAEEQQRQSEARALELGARFVAKLLVGLSSEEMQAKLIELLMTELQQLPPAQRDALLAKTENGKPESVKVLSAYPLHETQQAALKQYLDTLLSYPLRYTYTLDRKLLAGVRITVGSWVIHANLHDELKTFATIAYEQ